MKIIKLVNIQNVYLNSKKVTLFDVYYLKDNVWIFDCSDYLSGWYKREKTILNKYVPFITEY